MNGIVSSQHSDAVCFAVRLFVHDAPPDLIAALRHLGSSKRLVHLGLAASALAELVRADAQSWAKSASLKSLDVRALGRGQCHLPLDSLRRALPSLTHLHLPVHCDGVYLRHIAGHLGDRLTFLYVSMIGPLPQPAALSFSALQSIVISVIQRATVGMHPVPGTFHRS